ncbi:MAG: creatininase family protein [Candidatus Dormibacteraeota bacterium]|nr:creatininase family protein [Candidatus Dormibacteraeota bacterium]
MAELFLQRMSWPQIEAALSYGATTAVICAASTEQHGPHLPLATDELLGEAYARGLAERLGNALVAPLIRPGCSEHHMAFPGSLTIPAELLMDLLDQDLESLRRHGFTQFKVFSSHGGNYPPLARWAAERPHPDVRVVTSPGFFDVAFDAIRPFGRTDRAGPHADVIETSMMLYLYPDLVDMERAAPGFVGEARFEDLVGGSFRDFSENGIIGDPVGSTPVIGKAALEAICDHLAQVLG